MGMSKSIFFFGLAIFATSANPQTSNLDRAADAILDQFGLSDLPLQDRANARRLVLTLARQQTGDGLSESAKNYLENEGFKIVNLSLVEANGANYLVVKELWGLSATKDIPLGMRSLGFRSGPYFAKRSMLKGISEFIDDNGQLRRLSFASWIDLK